MSPISLWSMYVQCLSKGLLSNCDAGDKQGVQHVACQVQCITAMSQVCMVVLQVIIGAGHEVPPHSRISLCQSHNNQSSTEDEDVEYSAAGAAEV